MWEECLPLPPSLSSPPFVCLGVVPYAYTYINKHVMYVWVQYSTGTGAYNTYTYTYASLTYLTPLTKRFVRGEGMVKLILLSRLTKRFVTGEGRVKLTLLSPLTKLFVTREGWVKQTTVVRQLDITNLTCLSGSANETFR